MIVNQRETMRRVELHRSVALSRAQRAAHRVVLDRPKRDHRASRYVRDEDLARWRNSNAQRTWQRTGWSRQRAHPRAVAGPQHRHTTVIAIDYEEKGLVRG